MSDIENATPAVEEPDTLALVPDQAAAKEKAGKDDDDDKDDKESDDDSDDDDDDSDDDDEDDDDESDEDDDDESDEDEDDDEEDDDESDEDEDEDDDKDGGKGDGLPRLAVDEEPVEVAEPPAEASSEAAVTETNVTETAVIEAVAAEAVAVAAIAASAAVAQASGENVTDVVSPDHAQHLRLLEALIFAGTQALDEKELVDRLPNDADVKRLLADLAELYAGRGVNLVQVAGGYAFRTSPDLAEKLKIERPVTRKLSRASVETLAIIAYHQPVTRAEIEQVRGVGLSKGTLDLLFEQNWIKPMGRRRAPGKPVTWGTTDFFLEHFGLPSLDDLPGQEELKAAGLLDARAQPPIFRPDEPDLPLEPTEDETDEPLAVEEGTAQSGH
jgi:segregation and condensation protein B